MVAEPFPAVTILAQSEGQAQLRLDRLKISDGKKHKEK